MTGTLGESVHLSGLGLEPISVSDNLSVISVSYMLPSDDLAIVWKGPKKNGLIKRFLKDTNWGSEAPLDFLIIDTPPGTSDEHISVAKLLNDVEKPFSLSAIVISSSQELSVSDVKKEISFCRKVSIPILGLVENFSVFACPSCKKTSKIFRGDGCKTLASEANLALLASIPIDLSIGRICDEGNLESFSASPSYPIFRKLAAQIERQLSAPSAA